jgi:hypothetical protein
VKTKLLPKLHAGDVLVMDNLAAHHDPRVVEVCAQRGVEVLYLPPYSPDFNPSNRAGRFRSSSFDATHRGRRTHFVAWLAAHVTASRGITAANTLSTAATEVKPTDPWG